jgi:hypothetical protein
MKNDTEKFWKFDWKDNFHGLFIGSETPVDGYYISVTGEKFSTNDYYLTRNYTACEECGKHHSGCTDRESHNHITHDMAEYEK